MHLVNLMSIAYADGTITDEESDILGRIAQSLDLTEEEFNQCVEHWKQTDEADIPFADPQDEDEQIEYLKHFALVMMIDGKIEDSEKQYMITIADRFGFNGEEAVPALIDMVYQEYFADNEEEENEEEDPLFEDTYDESQIALGKSYLESKQIEDAFDELFLPALRNAEAFDYFQMIPGIDTRLFRLSDEQLEKVNEAAAKHYPLAYYVLGRFYQVAKPSEDAMEKAQKLLEAAAEAEVPDAHWALAMMYLYGYLGPMVIDHFNELIDQAIQNGSPMALKQRLQDMVHGQHGQKSEPKKVIALIDNFLLKDEENGNKFPFMHALLGDCYRKMGNKEKAVECYEKAVELGYFEAEACCFEARVEGPDKDHWRNMLDILLDSACDDNDPRGFLVRALESVYRYDNEDPSKHEATAQKIQEDLQASYRLGNGDAAYYMGLYHYHGSYGFEKDDHEAWTWFDKGQPRESGLAFAGMAQMITDGVKPDSLPSNYLEYCQLSALRRGVKEMLPMVIDAYKAGKLDALKEEVEKTYLPMLNAVSDQSDLPAIVIVSPNGDASIYRVEKEEWDKTPTLIGANRLSPVRVDALDQLGKIAGLYEHLVAWVDLDAPRKGLPSNNIIQQVYPGLLAGDVVFSLADKRYDPMPFYGIDEAKALIEVLKAKLKGTVTDLRDVEETKPALTDYSKVNPFADKGYVARIEPDGSAHLVNTSLGVFALFEEEIYDPMRLQNLEALSGTLGLKGRVTIWTDNDAVRKHFVMSSMAPANPIGNKICQGPVASNFFVAMEDEQCRIMLFDDVEQLKMVCLTIGVKEENIIIE